ncbi:cytochrome c oxidase subunit CcoM [Endozoicomonadaceae bacterium StTr2]
MYTDIVVISGLLVVGGCVAVIAGFVHFARKDAKRHHKH